MSKTYEVYPTTSYIPSKEEIEKLAEKYLNTFLEKANIKEEYKKKLKVTNSTLRFSDKNYVNRENICMIDTEYDIYQLNIKEGNAIFKDIEGHWAEKYIKAAVSDGWMAGYTDGEFKPNNYITRAEAAFFINNALDRKPGNKEDMLTDMKTWYDNADVEKW